MNIIFKNVMEALVLQKLDPLMDRLGCCKCDRCRMDVSAIALNQLAPKYVASPQGELFIKVDAMSRQHTADVMAAITSGIQIVKDNPRH